MSTQPPLVAICPHCGASVQMPARFCPQCGADNGGPPAARPGAPAPSPGQTSESLRAAADAAVASLAARSTAAAGPAAPPSAQSSAEQVARTAPVGPTVPCRMCQTPMGITDLLCPACRSPRPGLDTNPFGGSAAAKLLALGRGQLIMIAMGVVVAFMVVVVLLSRLTT